MFVAHHDGGKDCELIVNESSLAHVGSLKSNLKTATSHPESHAIHVNLVGFEGEGGDGGIGEKTRKFARNLWVSLGVDKEWQGYFDFLSASGSNVPS